MSGLETEVRRSPERSEEKPSREREAPGASIAAPGPTTLPATVLQLQRQLGNRQVQRMVEAAASGGEIAPEVERSISRSRGGGRPLDGEVRGRMEASFGADFGGVRVHTGGEADRLNRQLSARAFTTGSDVFFRDGEYRPGSSGGRELIAHELTHVVQQQGTVQTSRLTLGPPGDRFEQEADSVAQQVMRDEAVSVVPAVSRGGGVARSIQRQEGPAGWTPIHIDAGTFDEAAGTFALDLRALELDVSKIGIVVINGPHFRVYNGEGRLASPRAFRLKGESRLGKGAYSQESSENRRLLKLYERPDETWDLSAEGMTGDVDFAKDVDRQEEFNEALKPFGRVFYLVPGAEPGMIPDDHLPKKPPDENLPEFLKFQSEGTADVEPYPAAVVPLTPEQTFTGSAGKFYCKLDKVQWDASTLDNVFRLLERVNFRWEVLKLDANFLVTDKERATRWDATKERFRTRERHIREDESTMLGDGKANVPETVYRGYLTAQMAAPRRILGYTGEVMLTLMHSLVGGKDPNVEDFIDYTFKEPGDYFVRCLATPIMGSKATRRRATSVAGVLIQVRELQEVAAAAIDTPEEVLDKAVASLAQFDERLAELRKDRDEANTPDKKAAVEVRINLFLPRRAYLEAVQRAGGDTHGVLTAQLDLARAQLAYLTGKDVPFFRYTPDQVAMRNEIEKIKATEKRIAGQLERADSKLGDQVKRTGMMRASLLDDVTGAQQEVLLSIGERQLFATGMLEVVIADVTSGKGRRFTGTGSGVHARSDAWIEAMRDLQRHLGRGRGFLSWQAPPPYASLGEGLENPLQLKLAELDQIKELADDAMNALTLAALVAAPFTGGASLGVLAVLMPIQLGSSLYNIVNRAMYDDLELDADAIGSLLDIVSFGVTAKLGAAAKAAKAARRSVGMMSSNGRIALGLLDGGGYVVMTYSSYAEIMRDDPEETPEDARVRKLRALLGLLQGASIPIAHKLFDRAGMHPGGSRADESPAPRDKTAADEPAPARPAPEPADRTPADTAPAPRAADAPEVPKAYHDALQGVPKRVKPVINPELEAGTVRVQYVHTDGVITHMWIEIGPGTPASRVRQHARTARDMGRYMGLSGRVRKVYDQIAAWLSKNPAAGPGSRAWEAKLEVKKLQGIIDEHFQAYDKAVEEKNTALLDQLSRELDHLESQLLEHARAVDRFDDRGRGFVAAEGTGGTFSPETSRSEAFRELGGFETRAGTGGLEAASDLRRFVDAAVSEKVVTGPEELVRQMPDPRGLSHESVLRQTKEPYLAKLAERVTDAKRLRSLASYREARKAGASPAEALYRASHAEGTRILDLLPEADRAAFSEAWAAKSDAIPAPPGRRGEIQPETLTGVPAPPPPPAHKTLDQLLTQDKKGFTDKELQRAYEEYVAKNTRAGDPAATPEEWVNLTRGGPRERLETLLGPHHSFGGGGTGVERQLPLADFAQPASYTQARLDADVAAVEKDAGKLWERLGRLQNDGVTGGVVGESLFNILKGNAAEILSRPIQATELAKVQAQHPDARLYDDVRASIFLPDGTLSKPVLFTDNVIASKRGEGLQLHAVFEVKAGSKGGQEATSQVFDWIEGKLDEKIQIQVGGDTYVYDPAGTAPNRVIGLARAERHLIAAQGAEHLGLDSGDQIARASRRHALPQTADEINFLTRKLIEKNIKQNAQPPAPAATPAALPEPAGRPGTRDVVSPLEAAQEEYLNTPHELLSPEAAQWVLSATHASLEGAAMISEWTPGTNAVGAEVFKSLTRITSEPPHVEGLVVYGQRKGKKVTIITGYHGSSEGLTIPEKKFAVDDAKYYNEKYPGVDVIDTSEMTHDQRLALIEAIPGVVIVSTCFAASAAPSAAAPGQPRGGHAESSFLRNPEMFKRLSEGIDTRPRASYSVMIEHHRMPSPEQMREMFRDRTPAPAPTRGGAGGSPRYGLIETVQGVNVRRAMSDHDAAEGNAPLGEVRPGLEGFLEEGIHAVRASETTLGALIIPEAEKVLGKKGELWFSPSRELAERFAHDFDELIRHVQSVVDSY